MDRPSVRWISWQRSISRFAGRATAEFRVEAFNLFDRANFTNPVATLPLALPANSLSEANKVKPAQPYTAAAAGTFGTITSTVGRTVGPGTSRQAQFAFRLHFCTIHRRPDEGVVRNA